MIFVIFCCGVLKGNHIKWLINFLLFWQLLVQIFRFFGANNTKIKNQLRCAQETQFLIF
jgi:hypothetical protein